MIHRALMGSIERFFGILIEHYGGAFPTWLAPVQARVLPITDKQREYADAVVKQLVRRKASALRQILVTRKSGLRFVKRKSLRFLSCSWSESEKWKRDPVRPWTQRGQSRYIPSRG